MQGNRASALRLLTIALTVAAIPAAAQEGFGRPQTQRTRIDVQNYQIEATIDPRAQTISATAKVTFTPIDNASNVTFELNNALNLNRVTGEDGGQLTASRYQEDMTVREIGRAHV